MTPARAVGRTPWWPYPPMTALSPAGGVDPGRADPDVDLAGTAAALAYGGAGPRPVLEAPLLRDDTDAFHRVVRDPRDLRSCARTRARARSLRARAAQLQNISDDDATVDVLGVPWVMPPRSAFYLGDVSAALAAIRALSAPCRFASLLLDPPWPNRSATRFAGYRVTQRRELVRTLCAMRPADLLADGAAVGVWITNDPAVREAVEAEIFPAWGVRPVAASPVAWLKVTTAGDPVVPFGSARRKPYELLLVGRCGAGGAEEQSQPVAIASCPIRMHSHKPDVTDILDRLCGSPGEACSPADGALPPRLELYAREVRPNTLAVGDQALLLNRSTFFEPLHRHRAAETGAAGDDANAQQISPVRRD